MTRDRSIKNDAFCRYKVNWSSASTVHLTSGRWTQRTTAATQVKVYSNATSATLMVNGTSPGARSGADHIFTWPVPLRPGANTVTATATIDGTRHPVTDTVSWTLSTASLVGKTIDNGW